MALNQQFIKIIKDTVAEYQENKTKTAYNIITHLTESEATASFINKCQWENTTLISQALFNFCIHKEKNNTLYTSIINNLTSAKDKIYSEKQQEEIVTENFIITNIDMLIKKHIRSDGFKKDNLKSYLDDIYNLSAIIFKQYTVHFYTTITQILAQSYIFEHFAYFYEKDNTILNHPIFFDILKHEEFNINGFLEKITNLDKRLDCILFLFKNNIKSKHSINDPHYSFIKYWFNEKSQPHHSATLEDLKNLLENKQFKSLDPKLRGEILSTPAPEFQMHTLLSLMAQLVEHDKDTAAELILVVLDSEVSIKEEKESQIWIQYILANPKLNNFLKLCVEKINPTMLDELVQNKTLCINIIEKYIEFYCLSCDDTHSFKNIYTEIANLLTKFKIEASDLSTPSANLISQLQNEIPQFIIDILNSMDDALSKKRVPFFENLPSKEVLINYKSLFIAQFNSSLIRHYSTFAKTPQLGEDIQYIFNIFDFTERDLTFAARIIYYNITTNVSEKIFTFPKDSFKNILVYDEETPLNRKNVEELIDTLVNYINLEAIEKALSYKRIKDALMFKRDIFHAGGWFHGAQYFISKLQSRLLNTTTTSKFDPYFKLFDIYLYCLKNGFIAKTFSLASDISDKTITTVTLHKILFMSSRDTLSILQYLVSNPNFMELPQDYKASIIANQYTQKETTPPFKIYKCYDPSLINLTTLFNKHTLSNAETLFVQGSNNKGFNIHKWLSIYPNGIEPGSELTPLQYMAILMHCVSTKDEKENYFLIFATILATNPNLKLEEESKYQYAIEIFIASLYNEPKLQLKFIVEILPLISNKMSGFFAKKDFYFTIAQKLREEINPLADSLQDQAIYMLYFRFLMIGLNHKPSNYFIKQLCEIVIYLPQVSNEFFEIYENKIDTTLKAEIQEYMQTILPYALIPQSRLNKLQQAFNITVTSNTNDDSFVLAMLVAKTVKEVLFAPLSVILSTDMTDENTQFHRAIHDKKLANNHKAKLCDSIQKSIQYAFDHEPEKFSSYEFVIKFLTFLDMLSKKLLLAKNDILPKKRILLIEQILSGILFHDKKDNLSLVDTFITFDRSPVYQYLTQPDFTEKFIKDVFFKAHEYQNDFWQMNKYGNEINKQYTLELLSLEKLHQEKDILIINILFIKVICTILQYRFICYEEKVYEKSFYNSLKTSIAALGETQCGTQLNYFYKQQLAFRIKLLAQEMLRENKMHPSSMVERTASLKETINMFTQVLGLEKLMKDFRFEYELAQKPPSEENTQAQVVNSYLFIENNPTQKQIVVHDQLKDDGDIELKPLNFSPNRQV